MSEIVRAAGCMRVSTDWSTGATTATRTTTGPARFRAWPVTA
jgi:hypothetical protein